MWWKLFQKVHVEVFESSDYPGMLEAVAASDECQIEVGLGGTPEAAIEVLRENLGVLGYQIEELPEEELPDEAG